MVSFSFKCIEQTFTMVVDFGLGVRVKVIMFKSLTNFIT